jgi:hypothetical protein
MATLAPFGEPGPAWEVARLFPDQGQWGESDYLELTRHTRRLVELSEGRVEVLPVPRTSHQKIVACLYRGRVPARGGQRCPHPGLCA